jgi:RsmE family RNA methyltransferase
VEKSYWDSPALDPEDVREQLVLGLEQAVDTTLPTVEFRRRFKPFVEDELPGIAAGSFAVAGHPAAEQQLPHRLCGKTTLVIGPEGGFTDYEIDLLAAHGVTPMSFGPRIMRTEFAVTAILARME